MGCFSDLNDGHALPLLFANNSVTPELCIAYSNAQQAGPLPLLFLEYHHECYGGSSLTLNGAAVTTMIGTKACKDYCYGSVTTITTSGTTTVATNTANYCGGPKMFNLYALNTAAALPTGAGPMATSAVN
jgi:iron transport multicopper oxidase